MEPEISINAGFYMPRKTRFKQRRLYRFKIVLVSVVFVLILVFGLLAVDYSKSYIYYGKPKMEIVQISPVDSDIYRITILGNYFDLNLKYLKGNALKIKAFFITDDSVTLLLPYCYHYVGGDVLSYI